MTKMFRMKIDDGEISVMDGPEPKRFEVERVFDLTRCGIDPHRVNVQYRDKDDDITTPVWKYSQPYSVFESPIECRVIATFEIGRVRFEDGHVIDTGFDLPGMSLDGGVCIDTAPGGDGGGINIEDYVDRRDVRFMFPKTLDGQGLEVNQIQAELTFYPSELILGTDRKKWGI